MPRAAFAFSVITLLPVPLLMLAATLGGPFAWIALFYLTLFTFAVDELVALAFRHAPKAQEFPAADGLCAGLALAHFGLLALVVEALGNGRAGGLAEGIALFLATALFFGHVSNSVAHELIHRAGKPLHLLGKWVFISLLFGHHASAHLKVHHRFVGSQMDPNSARAGESYYRFAARAWIGSFVAGYRAERAMLDRSATRRHPYYLYGLGAIAVMSAALVLAGWGGLAVLIGLAGYAQALLLLSDYVQHYALRRQPLPDGRLEPVAARHSWNAPHWFSSHLMLNAPRHSDHHAHPARLFPKLSLPAPETFPTLPYSLPVMSVLALVPPVWRRVMDPRAAFWLDSAPDKAAA